MNNEILISICIPTYNRANYLDRCLQSIMHYTKNDIEVLIQDNDSIDNTSEIVQWYVDPRIKYEKNETNIGAVENIWKLINKAKGRYIFCLTDDDYFLPGAIQKIVNFITSINPVCFKTSLITLLEKSKRSFYYTIEDISKSSIFFIAHILTGLCFQKEKLLKKINREFLSNYYPSMVIMGLLLDEATYLDEVVAIHVWENEIFWDEGMEPGSKNLENEIVDLILMLKPYISHSTYKSIFICFPQKYGFLPAKFSKELTIRNKLYIYRNIIKLKIKKITFHVGKKILGEK